MRYGPSQFIHDVIMKQRKAVQHSVRTYYIHQCMFKILILKLRLTVSGDFDIFVWNYYFVTVISYVYNICILM